jgi:hypothetical protein
MKTKIISCIVFLLCLLLSSCNNDKTAPKVVSSYPESGAQNVDPDLKEIWVKFNEPMMNKSWSWSYRDKSKFPETKGDPEYAEDNTKCLLNVKLLPDQEYDIWINTDKLQNFKDKAGNPAVPFELKFKTR